jgi:hypothetical protein
MSAMHKVISRQLLETVAGIKIDSCFSQGFRLRGVSPITHPQKNMLVLNNLLFSKRELKQ